MKINSSLMIEYDQNNFFMYVETVNTGSFIVLLQGWAYACGSYIGCWHCVTIRVRYVIQYGTFVSNSQKVSQQKVC